MYSLVLKSFPWKKWLGSWITRFSKINSFHSKININEQNLRNPQSAWIEDVLLELSVCSMTAVFNIKTNLEKISYKIIPNVN